MAQDVDRTVKMVMDCCVLHNMPHIKNLLADSQIAGQQDPVTHATVEGTWRQDAVIPDMNAV